CRAFLALGVKPGSHVAVWATNVPQWYIAFWAATKIGAVLVTMNTAYKIAEAEYLLKQSDTHTLILIDGWRDSNYNEIIGQLCPELENTVPGEPLHSKRLPFLRNVITVGFKKKGCLTWDEAIARASEVPVEEVYRIAANVDVNDVCNMQYTSGTTGFPKGVMLTHYNIVNNGKNIGDRMDLSTADRMMIQVPMFHCFGMVLAMTATMTHGGTIFPLPYFSPKPSLACINNERITAFHGVPTMFIALLEHPDFPKTDFSYMRTGIMAGSPCPISVMQDVVNKMHMKEITIVYGQTEASPGCTMSSTDDPLEVRVATVGRALPEIECKIVNPETGEDCPDEVTGEFVARGYNIMKGYYKMPKATASTIDKDGWLHTGDLACRTADGNYRITGRLKDMIIRGGENIYPKEIEEFIYTHPKVNDVQVIGVPDEQYGEEICACIILKDGEEMTIEEMKQYIMDNMARHKVPKYIDFVDAFPMNAAGKILKYKMRENAIEKYGLQKANSVETA
ncbi:MAG: AMP-binding protein, partial [Acutalibacteraceae bacterium]|nr:AMP-binding protein [Acutalibacteraceae bacterium]